MSINDYKTLQKILDSVIGQIGLEQTIILLQNFIDNTSIQIDEAEKGKLITYLIKYNAIKVFGLIDQEFHTSNLKEYKDARMACHHILKKFTNWSYAMVGQAFSKGERNTRYYCEKVEEYLSLPDFYKDFIDKYTILETKFIEYLGKIN